MLTITNSLFTCLSVFFACSLGFLIGAFYGWALDFIGIGKYIDSGASAFFLNFSNVELWKITGFLNSIFYLKNGFRIIPLDINKVSINE